MVINAIRTYQHVNTKLVSIAVTYQTHCNGHHFSFLPLEPTYIGLLRMNAMVLNFSLLMGPHQSWVSSQTWLCLQYVTAVYLNDKYLYFYLDGETPPRLSWPTAPVYVSSTFQRQDNIEADVIMVVEDLSKAKLRGVHGRVVIVTNSLRNIEMLWKLYRLFDVLLLLPNSESCDVYTWKENSVGDIKPELLNTWTEGNFTISISLFSSLITQFFRGKTLRMTSNPYPMFSYPKTLDGPEDELVKLIADHLGFNLERVALPKEMPFYQIYNLDGTLTGFLSLLQNRTIDMAHGCLFLMYEDTLFADYLPQYSSEDLLWSTAAPKPKQLSSGLYSGFGTTLWCLIFLVFILYSTTFYILCRGDFSASDCVLSAYKMTFSQGFGVKTKKTVTRVVLTIYSIYSLHIIWFYQSTLLVNLFQIQYEKEIKSFEEAVKDGLTVAVHDNFDYLVPNPPTGAWKTAKASGKLNIFTRAFHRQRVLTEKNILLLGARNGDRTAYQTLNPNKSLHHFVRFLKEPVASFPVTIYVSPGHPLVPIFSLKVQQIVESGIFLYWYRLKKHKYFLQGEIKIDNRKPLKVENLMVAFEALMAFLIASCVLFLLEINKVKYCRRGRTNSFLNRKFQSKKCGKNAEYF